MNELVKVTTNEKGEQLVSARELHNFLEIGTQFSKWFNRMCEYGFEENVNYVTVVKNVYGQNGQLMPQTENDYIMQLSMAKELSMLQRNDKGKQARAYFIKCEEAWNSPAMILGRANQIQAMMISNYEKEVSQLRLVVVEQKPKVEYFDKVLDSKHLLTATQIGKAIGMSAAKLNSTLNEKRIIYKKSGTWTLYKEYEHMIPEYAKYDISEFGQLLKWTEKGRRWILGILSGEVEL